MIFTWKAKRSIKSGLHESERQHSRNVTLHLGIASHLLKKDGKKIRPYAPEQGARLLAVMEDQHALTRMGAL